MRNFDYVYCIFRCNILFTSFSQIGLLSFIDTVGSIFGPLFGLIVCDYYLIKRKKIINKDIFLSNKESAYFYSNGWHLKAIYSVFIGFIFASSTIWNVNLQFLQTFSWIIGAFTSYVTYYFIASKKWIISISKIKQR